MFKKLQSVFTRNAIPYLELPGIDDPITIPYLNPGISGGSVSSARSRIFTLYDELLLAITKTTSLVVLSGSFAILGTIIAFMNNTIVAYGDAESHLNIAKRVIGSLTPGLSQLGGIWLPIPHLLMLPFIWNDFLWRTGLAGSIVSSLSYVIAAVYLYKLTYLLTKNKLASFVSFLIFVLNPNIVYMQATPMTELPLIMFFTLSSYYFVKYLLQSQDQLTLIAAAFFAFCASLSRYDGWFLVLFETLFLVVFYLRERLSLKKIIGKSVFFGSLAMLGIAIWMIWGYIILGDPLYFTTSEFSAKSQQNAWLARGELPTYHDLFLSAKYYFITSMENVGSIIFSLSLAGILYYLLIRFQLKRILISLLLICPFIFYVFTLYLGQSVIFIPSLTPTDYEWNLFNVRYGIMMVPIAAIFFAYLFAKSGNGMKVNLIALVVLQTGLFMTQTMPTISLADGTVGLSRYKYNDAQGWISANYTGGLVLVDDFARTVSIIRTSIPMENIIYIGNKPYWEESLENPDAHATWIIMQRGDSLWKGIYENSEKNALLFTHFKKVYTSPDILIFKKI